MPSYGSKNPYLFDIFPCAWINDQSMCVSIYIYLVGGWVQPLWKMMDFGNVGMMIFPIWSGKSSNSCSKPPTRLDEIWVIHIIWFSIYHLGIEQKYFFGEMNGIYHLGFHSTIKEGFTIWVFHIAMGDCPFSSMIVIFFYRSWKLCVYVIFRNHIKLPEGNTVWQHCDVDVS
jgi:hypothetical protein